MSLHYEAIRKFIHEHNLPGIEKKLTIDKETAIELLKVLNYQYIDHELYGRVHELIKKLNEFVE